MSTPLISKRKALSLTTALFLVWLAILSYTELWWPGIMLAIGIPLALRQAFLGKYYDMLVTLFVFVGVFVTVEFSIAWQILLPVLFTTGGIYIFFRDWVESEAPLAEEEDNMNLEIHDSLGKSKKKSVKKSAPKKTVKVKPPVKEAPKKKKTAPRKVAKSAPVKVKDLEPIKEVQ